jgi:chorismate mutase
VSFEVTDNLAELRGTFDEADRALVRGAREAVRDAAKVGEAKAKASHRYKDRSGALTASTKGHVTRDTDRGAEGVVEATAEHAAFVHQGTKAHVIEPRRAKALRFEQDGAIRFAQRVQHPGTTADPFIDQTEPAVDAELERGGERACDRAAQILGG